MTSKSNTPQERHTQPPTSSPDHLQMTEANKTMKTSWYSPQNSSSTARSKSLTSTPSSGTSIKWSRSLKTNTDHSWRPGEKTTRPPMSAHCVYHTVKSQAGEKKEDW